MQEQLGKYSVIRRLGVGGMAEVFLCKLVGIGGFEKHVVLKKIRADIASDDEFITMFFDEARLAANLNHPNIIQVFEVDQLDGTPYLAMEYVRGATLAAVHKKLRETESQMDFGYVAYVFAGVCAGLDHAHNARDASGRQLNIVHRDISPQNIIISADGTPKIFDFGVAKARGSLSLTGVDRVKGKFAYMAPEQLRAQPVDAKADVYAVGVCMYEAVTGRRPFTGQTEAELYAARIAGKFRMPSELVPSIPVELEHIILSAMASDPADRPTAIELHEALAAFCAVGSRFPTSTQAIVGWLRELLGGDVTEAYEGYSTAAPSLTPLPRSANLPPTTNAVEAHDRRPLGLTKAIALLASAAVVLAAVLVALLLRKTRDEPAPVASASRPVPAAARPAPVSPAPAPQDVELRREVERMRAELEAARRAEPPAPLPAVAIDEPEQRRTNERTSERANERSNERINERTVERAKKPVPVRVAAASKPSTSHGSGSGSMTGGGNGSARHHGSAAHAGSATGSGSAQPIAAQHVASQVPIPPAPVRPVATSEPAKITAVPAPPVGPPVIAGPGSLDATPSFTKLAVDGSLTATEISSTLSRSIDTLRNCYRAAARKANQTPEVTIRVSFEIDEGARASDVRISGDTFGLGACAKDAISGLRTRVAPDVGTVSVSTVVRFKPTR